MSLGLRGFLDVIEAPDIKQGCRRIHFRADDLDRSDRALHEQRLALVRKVVVCGLRRAVLDGDGPYRIPITLAECAGPAVVAAMKAEDGRNAKLDPRPS